jgi:A/G-specific adenine glycosylase
VGLPVDPDEIDALHQRLLAWFADHRRELPWREVEDEDPYSVLVREIMLQQTRMSTALPYYEDWMNRWPTVEDLADANEDDVLDAWQGLGYYNRARWLLETARTIRDDHGGTVPQRVDELEDLQGVGPYTAAAVASMAFDKPAPSVDGNMARVIARVDAIEGDVTKDKIQREIRQRLGPLFDRGQPGRLNEALMELGSLVCTPAAPNCEVCPIQTVCTAYAEDRVDELPTERSTPDLTVHAVTALAIREDDCVLVRRRAPGGLLGGLWGPPVIEHDEASPPATIDPDLEVRVTVDEATVLGRLEHTFSHKRWRVRVLAADTLDEAPSGSDWRFVDPTDPDVPTSTLDDRVFDALAGDE